MQKTTKKIRNEYEQPLHQPHRIARNTLKIPGLFLPLQFKGDKGTSSAMAVLCVLSFVETSKPILSWRRKMILKNEAVFVVLLNGQGVVPQIAQQDEGSVNGSLAKHQYYANLFKHKCVFNLGRTLENWNNNYNIYPYRPHVRPRMTSVKISSFWLPALPSTISACEAYISHNISKADVPEVLKLVCDRSHPHWVSVYLRFVLISDSMAGSMCSITLITMFVRDKSSKYDQTAWIVSQHRLDIHVANSARMTSP